MRKMGGSRVLLRRHLAFHAQLSGKTDPGAQQGRRCVRHPSDNTNSR